MIGEAAARGPRSAKIIVAGGSGVGKTTLVGTLSEIPASGTTDFGRVTINDQMVLYLFGTPGQDRFGFLWDDLVVGALGAVVLVDLRRIDDAFGAIDFFESRRIPFIVAINRFEDGPAPKLAEVREALDLPADQSIVECDARTKESVKSVVLSLLELLIDQFKTRRQSGVRKAFR
jgi:signal recognition particle receptor subunit beta